MFYSYYAKLSEYFPEPYERFNGDISVKLDLSVYATKKDLKRSTGVDLSNLAAKLDLVSLKTELDQTDVDKLKTVPANLNELSNELSNCVVKKTVYGKLINKTNAADTSGFVLKTQYDADKLGIKKINDVDKKIPGIGGLVKKLIITPK